MKRLARLIGLTALTAMLLSGCMYPGSGQGSGSGVSTGEYTVVVANAVEAYLDRTGVLPIHNSEMDTPTYEKYRVDFKALRDRGLISTIPPDAFEEGGYYYYMIVDPESGLKIRLLDLRVSQAAADVQRMVDSYKIREGSLPLLEPVSNGFHTIDFRAMGQSIRQARSVYSGHYLTYLLHESGRVAVDYAPDIMTAVEMSGGEAPEADIDLRALLIEQSPFVPAASYPYKWENGEPVIQSE